MMLIWRKFLFDFRPTSYSCQNCVVLLSIIRQLFLYLRKVSFVSKMTELKDNTAVKIYCGYKVLHIPYVLGNKNCALFKKFCLLTKWMRTTGGWNIKSNGSKMFHKTIRQSRKSPLKMSSLNSEIHCFFYYTNVCKYTQPENKAIFH